jgi:hypothetical protein
VETIILIFFNLSGYLIIYKEQVSFLSTTFGVDKSKPIDGSLINFPAHQRMLYFVSFGRLRTDDVLN